MCDSCNCKSNVIGGVPKKDGRPTGSKFGLYVGQAASPVSVKPGVKSGSGIGKGK